MKRLPLPSFDLCRWEEHRPLPLPVPCLWLLRWLTRSLTLWIPCCVSCKRSLTTCSQPDPLQSTSNEQLMTLPLWLRTSQRGRMQSMIQKIGQSAQCWLFTTFIWFVVYPVDRSVFFSIMVKGQSWYIVSVTVTFCIPLKILRQSNIIEILISLVSLVRSATFL